MEELNLRDIENEEIETESCRWRWHDLIIDKREEDLREDSYMWQYYPGDYQEDEEEAGVDSVTELETRKKDWIKKKMSFWVPKQNKPQTNEENIETIYEEEKEITRNLRLTLKTSWRTQTVTQTQRGKTKNTKM